MRCVIFAFCAIGLLTSQYLAASAQSLSIEKAEIGGRGAPAGFGRKFVRYDSEAFFITYFVIGPKQRIELVLPDKSDDGGASLGRLYRREKPIAAMNGGFLRSLLPATPAGLVQINSAIVNKPAGKDPVISGVACFDEFKTPIIVPTRLLKETQAKYDDCVEAGPLLLFKGAPADNLEDFDDRNPDLKRFVARQVERSFIARNSKRQTVLGVTAPTSLIALRAALIASEKDGGFGAVSAITLTGRSTAGLIVRGANAPIEAGGTSAFLPNAIMVHDD